MLRPALLVLLAILVSGGCNRGPTLVPAAGRVLLDGRPLETGAIMVQPEAGPAAQAKIGADGGFQLGTFKPGDGAIVGPATVRIFCRKDITPPGGEQAWGPSLIPERYTRFDTSGLSVTIEAGMPPLEISLSSK